MNKKELTFNDLPHVAAQLLEEVMGMKAELQSLQNLINQQPRENRHRTVTPEQLAEFTQIPLATVYQKLENGDIPATKPGKRWIIFLDEVDKWLESHRKNPVPQTDEEINAGIRASHRRKSHTPQWAEEDGVSSFDEKVRTKETKASKVEKQEEVEDVEEVKEEVRDIEDVVTGATPIVDKTAEPPLIEEAKQEHDSVEEEPALISFEQMCSAYPKPDKPGNFLNDAMRFWESFDTATRHAAIDGVKGYIEQHPRYSDQVFLNRYLRERLWLSTNPNTAELA